MKAGRKTGPPDGRFTVAAEPVPGTGLHLRATAAGRRACPVYRGDGGLATACAEALAHGHAGITYKGETYVLLAGKWFPLRLI